MPTEYYIGIAIALILICLLGLLIKPARNTRRVVQQKPLDSDQLANQLSRIADSLEILVARLGSIAACRINCRLRSRLLRPRLLKEPPIEKPPIEKPDIEQPSVPVENAVEPADANQEKLDQPVERHVRLSMFGR